MVCTNQLFGSQGDPLVAQLQHPGLLQFGWMLEVEVVHHQ